MADVAELQVVIGAKVDGAIAGINKVDASINKFGQTAELSTRHALGFSRGIEDLAINAQQGTLQMGGLFEVLRVGAIEFQNIKTETGSTSAAFKALGGAIFTPQTVILLLITSIAQLTSEFLASKKEATAFEDALKDAGNAMASMSGNTTKELTGLQALLSAARDTTLSEGERKNAIDQLNKVYPGLHNNITIANIDDQNSTILINKLTDAIVRKGQAEALGGLISKTQAAIFEAQNKPLSEQVDFLDQIGALFKTLHTQTDLSQAGLAAGVGTNLTTTAFKNQAEAVKGLEGLLTSYIKQLNDVVHTQVKAGDFKLLTPDKVNNIKGVASILEDLSKKLKQLSGEAVVFGTTFNPEKINAIKAAIIELLGIGVSPTSETIRKLSDEMDALKAKLIDFKGTNLGLQAPPAITIPTKALTALGDESLKRLQETSAKTFADMQKNIHDTVDAVTGFLKPAFDSVFNSIENGQNAFQAVGNAIKQLIVKMVEAVIEAAALALILSAVTGSPVSFGSIFGQISGLGNLIHPHASGGVVPPGFPNDSYLAALTSGERIIPAGQSPGFTTGGDRIIHIKGEISGRALKLLLDREEKATGRTY